MQHAATDHLGAKHPAPFDALFAHHPWIWQPGHRRRPHRHSGITTTATIATTTTTFIDIHLFLFVLCVSLFIAPAGVCVPGTFPYFMSFISPTCILFIAELLERVFEVSRQDVPDVGDINVRRQV